MYMIKIERGMNLGNEDDAFTRNRVEFTKSMEKHAV